MTTVIKAQAGDADFAEVVRLIGAARQKANRTVNAQLVDLYWVVGEYVSKKIATNAWGKATVSSLADYIRLRQPGQRGFSAQNIWRMRQFYEAYCDAPILSTLLRELPWSSHLHILSGSKLAEEREFYLRMAKQEQWQVREVARQMDTQLFARTVTQPPKLSTVVEYALSRSLSPAMIAEYQTQLPDKKLLQAKLHEFYLLNIAQAEGL